VGSIGRLALLATLSCAAAAAPACEVPDEGGNTPWRRAVAKVRYLPEIEAWAEQMAREQAIVQYVVLLDEPRHASNRCWWPVEVRVGGKVWKRFLVTPDGSDVREEKLR